MPTDETFNTDTNTNSNIKLELEQTKAQLTELTNLNKQYEEAYKELVLRYNKLRAMLDTIIEYSLSVKQ